MGYVILALIAASFAALGVWDYRARRRGHVLRQDARSGVLAARRRDFRTGPSSMLTGVPALRDPPPPAPPEDENRIRR